MPEEDSRGVAREPETVESGAALASFHRLVGTEALHVVAAGETLGALARRYGTTVDTAAAMNGLADPGRLRIGDRLRLSNRRLLPTPLRDGLVVDLPVLRLYWMKQGEVLASFPIAAGRSDWETPAGAFRITSRRRDPTWTVPVSIQREMRAQGLPVRTRVAPGPDNPLGRFWIQLSAPNIGIHGTNAPWSIGRFATHGCIRMRDADVERLFTEVPDGTPVTIVNEAVRIARMEDGRVFVESHRRGKFPSESTVSNRLAAVGLTDEASQTRVKRILTAGWGVAVEVGPAADADQARR